MNDYKCDKVKCVQRGRYVYCMLEKGKYQFRNCCFYNTPISDNGLEHFASEEEFKQAREGL